MMTTFVAHPAILLALALACGLSAALLGRRALWFAPLAALLPMLATFAFGVATLAGGRVASGTLEEFPWFTSGTLNLSVGLMADSLVSVVLIVVGAVASCVVVFSIGYMSGDEGWARYFALLSLFVGAMDLLVLADGLTGLFIGWELVGACSYLLIGYWFAKPSAVAAAQKAFLTTRVGDVGLLAGIAVMLVGAGTDKYAQMDAVIAHVAPATITAVTVCLAVGAMGKSAQFPLHAWLPDAMEGPTPVSALIHAATMVAAGVFLVARTWPLFEAAPSARMVLLVAGAVSALGSALLATVATDIKKVLAYSTISQLGFMFAALGAGAMAAAVFHLVAHAAFKAMLFLAAGSVIHGAHTQELAEMGGLRRKMPLTFTAWTGGVLALAGIFPFAGFFSKDLILERVWASAPLAGVILFLASAVTGFYAVRTTRLAFMGDSVAAHEGSGVIVGPLMALLVPTVGLGAVSAAFVSALGEKPEPLALAVSAVALTLAGIGGAVGWMRAGRERPVMLASNLPVVRALRRGLGWDALVDEVAVRPSIEASRGIWALGDRMIMDVAAESPATLARWLGRSISRLQSGDAQSYSAVIVIAFLAALITASWLGVR